MLGKRKRLFLSAGLLLALCLACNASIGGSADPPIA